MPLTPQVALAYSTFAFPLKMMLQPDGHLTSCDILHTVAGAIIFDVYENQDARLVSLQNSREGHPEVFPGPATVPRACVRLQTSQPTAPLSHNPQANRRITPSDVEQLVSEIAECPLFLFVKEDEDLYPNLDYSPVAERTRRAVAAIDRARDKSGAAKA